MIKTLIFDSLEDLIRSVLKNSVFKSFTDKGNVATFLSGGSKTALSWNNELICYDTLLKRVSIASKLYQITAGDRVVIWAENSLEWSYSFYSVWVNQGVAVPIDTMATAEEAQNIILDCKPNVIFYSRSNQEKLDLILKQLDYTPNIILLNDIDFSKKVSPIEHLSVEEYQKTALLIYTSGTTGTPKGVMLSYDNILANIQAVTETVQYFTADQTVMALLPLHHIYPLLGSLVAPLYMHAKIAFCPSLSSEDILGTLQKSGVTMIIGVPKLYDTIIKGIKNKINQSVAAKSLFALAQKTNSLKFSKLVFKSVHKKFGGKIRFMICGGAKLDLQVAQDFRTLGFEICEGYGMSETAPMISFPPIGKVVMGSAGRQLYENSVKIVEGEFMVRGRQVMQGYYNNPKATTEAFEEGWLKTGDLGHIDAEGNIFITGRKKEMIVLPSGKNINPVEIESKISAMTNLIKEIAVVQKGDGLHALIVPEIGKVQERSEKSTADMFRWEVIEKYNKSVSPYKKILGMTFLENPLPRTRLEKLQRFKLTALIDPEKQTPSVGQEPESEEYRMLKKYIFSIKKTDFGPDDHLEFDIGIDSLDKVILMDYLRETFGVLINENDLMEISTVRKLTHFIVAKKTKIDDKLTNWGDILKQKINFKISSGKGSDFLVKRFSERLLSLYFKISVKEKVELPASPFIIAANHQTFFDSLFILKTLKLKVIRNTFFLAKGKHFEQGWKKKFASWNNIILIDLNEDLVLTIQKMAALLKKGKNVIIFPEGTRSNDGSLGEFKQLFAILSKELDVPVIPVGIKGGYEAAPKGHRIPKFKGKVSVQYLPAVFPAGKSYEAIVKQVKESIETAISMD